jgi:hypothetical protein
MTYLKSYAETLLEIGKMLSLIYMVMSFFMGSDGASFFIYLAIVSSAVGPASLFLESERK